MQAGDGKLGDAGQHVGKPGLWIDVVEASRRNQGQHDGGPVGAPIGSGEAPIFSAASHAAQGSFRRVIRHADPAVVGVSGKVGPARQHIVDGFNHR